MVVEAIDIMQTEQIEDLQEDVQELEDKINLAVTDVNALTGKLNSVLGDLRIIYEALMGSDSTDEYSPSGSTSTDGLLTRLDELYTVFWDHIHMPPFSSTSQTYRSSHPPYVPSSNPGSPSHTSSKPTSLSTISQTTVTSYTATAQAASVTGLYTPVPSKVAIVLKNRNEKRARKLTRKVMGQITAEDRANTNV